MNSNYLKKLLVLLVVLFPFIIKAQANLGYSVSEIEALHPDNLFKLDYTTEGKQYIYSDYTLGTFYYYINPETKVSDMCLQIPNNITDLNTQVQIYNRNYVVTSDTTWKAYIEKGAIMYIKLKYSAKYETSSFVYTNDYQ